MTTMTMPIAKATVLADESGIADLIAAVQQAAAAGWDVVDFVIVDEGGNVEVRPHTGVMVAWMLPDYVARRLQVIGGEEDLHVTLAYLGDVADLSLEQQRLLVGVVAEVLQDQKALYGLIQGTGTFPPKDDADERPWFAEVNIPGLAELRAKLVAALDEAGLPVDTTYPDYHPHVTLQYLDAEAEDPAVTLDAIAIEVDDISVCLGGERRQVKLCSPEYERWGDPDDTWSDEDRASQAYWAIRRAWYKALTGDEYGYTEWSNSAYRPFAKAVLVGERQFTLGPWYIPGVLDAHGEWTDANELQAALWRYVQTGYRSIHIQHMPDIVAGEWVEVMTLPYETTWPVVDVAGDTVAHTYPAGTVMMGVKWDDWAWELVKDGTISGYSIGGNAARVEEDPDEEDEAAGAAQPVFPASMFPSGTLGGVPVTPPSAPGV